MVRPSILDWIEKKLTKLIWTLSKPADVEVKPTGKSKVILTLDSDVFDLLTNYALNSGLEISEVVERAVKQYCGRPKRGILSEYF
jgi:hypothetical protein